MDKKARLPSKLSAMLVACFTAASAPSISVFAIEPPSPTTLTKRGPLHAAFAHPLTGADVPGTIVDRRPGAPLDETPAATTSGMARAVWIPGYWGWEPATGEHVWAPGVWRVPPPGRRWVPGYWSQADNAWRWVRGFWFPLNQPRLQYLPGPPPPQDKPPASNPADGRFTVPGYWSLAGGKYVWKQGFQAALKAGWVWMPSHYAWTPRGSLFVPGYWDFAIDRRGLAPAPAAPGNSRTNLLPRPELQIDLAELSEALFIAAGQGHFYFGDYFDFPPHADGVKPWYEPDARQRLEPLYVYERWRHERTGTDWAKDLAERYRARRGDTRQRPRVVRSSNVPTPMTRRSPDLVRAAALAANGFRHLALMRERFESSGEPARAEDQVVLHLPPDTDSQTQPRATDQARTGVTEESLPGITGRQVPGVKQRSLPGVSGRTVPGIEADLPDVAAPGVERREISPRR